MSRYNLSQTLRSRHWWEFFWLVRRVCHDPCDRIESFANLRNFASATLSSLFQPGCASYKMGNVHGHVINDTEEKHRILTFNFGDEIRHEPANVYDIFPFQTVPVSAEMCPVRGMIVSTGVAKTGKHCVLLPNESIKISDILRQGDDNPAYQEALKIMTRAACTNLPTEEAKERRASVVKSLMAEEQKAQKKYNRKPVRVFKEGVVETIQSSLQAAESSSTRKSSNVSNKQNEGVNYDQNLAAPSQPGKEKKDD